MARQYSDSLLTELQLAVKRALHREGTVNVPAVASEIKERHPVEDLSLAELEAQVMTAALAMGAAIFFQGTTGNIIEPRRAKPKRTQPRGLRPPQGQS
ncbi:hypothetical protein [Chelativorans salis]|uniref:Uncharacterized protein n=1 Tax=Chelativorans salis TaxID=2978478 RepID=A0ABT2LQH6_9HYPH|nr:hypothetical protein [Chelativorans sp. EGI FJ00035]MCT7375454.1 hypothetical protein [Chelativorans sp. EGI FJ00035]